MQEKIIALDTPVRYLKGVGPKRGAHLERLGIRTVRDILYYLPARYEDRSHFTPLGSVVEGSRETVRGEVLTASRRVTRRGASIFEVTIGDPSGRLLAVWFNQPYLAKVFTAGQTVVLHGNVRRYEQLQLTQPEYEILSGAADDSIHIGQIVPIYSLTSQVTQRFLRGIVHATLARHAPLPEAIPTQIRARQRLVDIRFAVRAIHFPSSFEHLERAYRRIVFEEFFLLQLALALRKRSVHEETVVVRQSAEGPLASSLLKNLDFALTPGQTDAIRDIAQDMSSTKPMSRLLEGDVGCGKTVVAAYAAAVTVQSGMQAVVMAPTEVLARQHYLVLSRLLMPLGLNVGLLVRGMEKGFKDRLRTEVANGGVDVVVGTHAVIQEAVEFRALGLAVIDEQHKFGVAQRARLRRKGTNPHLLVMTATPIPRTLALTVYGDLDISIIRELPKGRRPIATYWVDETKREDVYRFIKNEVSGGRQVYIVCPFIDSAGEEGARSASAMHATLSREVFGDCRVGLLHGRMGTKEKEKVMRAFRSGKTDILVATVVIEVGIDVPNASVMLIEGAERFGLAQLHQLRGRIGRGGHESYCILLADPRTESARKRLEAIEDTIDGFEIAEEDLQLRGPGEFFGTSQHGLPEIRFGNIVKDSAIMEDARKEAFALIERDPALSGPQHRLLSQALRARFKGSLALLGAG